MRPLTLAVPLLCLLQIGCGDDAGSDSNSSSGNGSGNGSDNEGELDVSGLLSESLVRSHFEVGDAEVTASSSEQSRYSTSRVFWPRSNHEELQAEFQAKVKEYAMAKARREDAEMPKSPRLNCEISLTVPNKRFDDAAQAQSALDTGLDILKNGLKTRPKDPARVAEINIQPVDGLGDKAAWTTPQNQLSVANGRRIFHLIVSVSDDPEANRAKAVELAKLFVKDIH